jgi:alkyl hydroperoxide reductase subunit AhpC
VAVPARGVFVVNSDLKLKLSLLYPKSVGLSLPEIFRALDALQLTAAHPILNTPEGWTRGGEVVVKADATSEQVAKAFTEGTKLRKSTLPSDKKM